MAERDPFYVALGARVRAQREKLRLTQADLADAVGISRTSLTNIESGRQRILVDQLAGLSRKLLISPAELIPIENDGGKKLSRTLTDIPAVATFVESVFRRSTQ
jgi:transcriptional regulator with XRE-family HTH domain